MKTFMTGCLLLLIVASCKRKITEQSASKGRKASSELTITSYYVNGASGNDANAGTSAATALKTIQAA